MTAAGARFIKGAQYGSAEGYFLHAGTVEWLEAQVAAIEAEAAARAVDEALSVERVAEALNAVDYHMVDDWASGDEPPTRLAALVAHLRGPRP